MCLSYSGCEDSEISAIHCAVPWTNMFFNLQQPAALRLVCSICTVSICAAPERCSTKDCATWTCLYTTEACLVPGGVGMAYSSLCCTTKYLFKRACASSVCICQRSLCCCTLITLQSRNLTFHCFIFRFASWDFLCCAPFLLLSPKL